MKFGYRLHSKGKPGLFSFEYDLLPNLVTDFNSYNMDQALNMKKVSVKKAVPKCIGSIIVSPPICNLNQCAK